MYFEKRFRVGVQCVCGAKLDAYLADIDQNHYDFMVVVDNTHICPAAQQERAADGFTAEQEFKKIQREQWPGIKD